MRAVVQRVTESSVTVDNTIVGRVGHGLLVLLGVETGDDESDAAYMAKKIASLRIFNDSEGKFNLTLGEVQGAILVISQFTLLGDCRRGRRPSFSNAAQPGKAIPLYESVIQRLRAAGFTVESGVFGAHMDVRLLNDGPVTILLDSKKAF